jgi:hypothetical protein
MQNLLDHPGVQAGAAPLLVGLIVATLLGRVRLGGLAATAGFCVAVALISGFAFTPLNALRKLVLVGLGACVLGIAADSVLRSGRTLTVTLSVLGAVGAVWVFWVVLAQKELQVAIMLGVLAAGVVAWLVGTTYGLAAQPVRAGAAALALALGAGALAILGRSQTYGLYGIALGAGSGGFLLWQMLTNRTIPAGVTLVLPASVIAGLLAVGAVVLAQLPWYSPVILALVPLAVRLPAPDRAPVALRAIVLSLYGFLVAAIAFLAAWYLEGAE